MLFAGACGSSGGTQSPLALLASARKAVDATPGVHFKLSSRNIPATGTTLTGGEGDLTRPGQLKATFQVSLGGLPANVNLIEVGGKLYAELPFSTGYKPTSPSEFGLGDPAALLNPKTGVSGLLTTLSHPTSAGQTRYNGELLDQVSGTVPGTAVTGFLPDVDTSQPVKLTFGIDPSTHQVRTVQAVGPFASAKVASVYTVVLTKYGESVKITAPTT